MTVKQLIEILNDIPQPEITQLVSRYICGNDRCLGHEHIIERADYQAEVSGKFLYFE